MAPPGRETQAPVLPVANLPTFWWWFLPSIRRLARSPPFAWHLCPGHPALLFAQPGRVHLVGLGLKGRCIFCRLPTFLPSLPCSQGTHLPSLSRALVACGWFGIQTWIGGSSIYQMAVTLSNGAVAGPVMPALGISAPELACFLAFWAMQVSGKLRV